MALTSSLNPFSQEARSRDRQMAVDRARSRTLRLGMKDAKKRRDYGAMLGFQDQLAAQGTPFGRTGSFSDNQSIAAGRVEADQLQSQTARENIAGMQKLRRDLLTSAQPQAPDSAQSPPADPGVTPSLPDTPPVDSSPEPELLPAPPPTPGLPPPPQGLYAPSPEGTPGAPRVLPGPLPGVPDIVIPAVPAPLPGASSTTPPPALGVPAPLPGPSSATPPPALGVPAPLPGASPATPPPALGVPAPLPGPSSATPPPALGVPAPLPALPAPPPTPALGASAPLPALPAPPPTPGAVTSPQQPPAAANPAEQKAEAEQSLQKAREAFLAGDSGNALTAHFEKYPSAERLAAQQPTAVASPPSPLDATAEGVAASLAEKESRRSGLSRLSEKLKRGAELGFSQMGRDISSNVGAAITGVPAAFDPLEKAARGLNRAMAPARQAVSEFLFERPESERERRRRVVEEYRRTNPAANQGPRPISNAGLGIPRTNPAANQGPRLIEPREKGGPVTAGKPYLVGEKGPEIVVPQKRAASQLEQAILGVANAGGDIVKGSAGLVAMATQKAADDFRSDKTPPSSFVPIGERYKTDPWYKRVPKQLGDALALNRSDPEVRKQFLRTSGAFNNVINTWASAEHKDAIKSQREIEKDLGSVGAATQFASSLIPGVRALDIPLAVGADKNLQGGLVPALAVAATRKISGGTLAKNAAQQAIGRVAQPYLVGENGPEIIVPRQSGTVIPNHAIKTPAMDKLASQTQLRERRRKVLEESRRTNRR